MLSSSRRAERTWRTKPSCVGESSSGRECLRANQYTTGTLVNCRAGQRDGGRIVSLGNIVVIEQRRYELIFKVPSFSSITTFGVLRSKLTKVSSTAMPGNLTIESYTIPIKYTNRKDSKKSRNFSSELSHHFTPFLLASSASCLGVPIGL